MKILEKYVAEKYIVAFLFCITLLIVLGMVGDILGFLDDIIKNDIPLPSILAFYFYLAPFAFVNMIPFACLLSAVFVFNSLSKNHEVTAVIASGVSLWRILRPVLLVTFILCLTAFIVNDKFVPVATKKANSIRYEKLEQSKDNKNAPIKDLAVYGKGNRIIYAKYFIPVSNTLQDVIIHKQNKQNTITNKISVSSMKWMGDGSWLGKGVIEFRIDSAGNFEGDPIMSDSKLINISETPDDFLNNQWDPKFMSYAQLRKYINFFSIGAPSTLRRLLVDLHYKLAFPFTAFIMVLIGVPFSIATGRASALIGMAKGITVAISYLPVMAICLALGKGGVLPPMASAWMSNVLFAFIGIFFIRRKS